MRKVIIIIFCILGMIVGVAVGQAVSGVSFLNWLSWGGEFGINPPVVINLGFLQFTFGIWCKVSIAGVIGMVIFAFISKFIVSWLKI